MKEVIHCIDLVAYLNQGLFVYWLKYWAMPNKHKLHQMMFGWPKSSTEEVNDVYTSLI